MSHSYSKNGLFALPDQALGEVYRPKLPEGICGNRYYTDAWGLDTKICKRPKDHSGPCGPLTEAEGVAALQATQGLAAAAKLEKAVTKIEEVASTVQEASAKTEKNLSSMILALSSRKREVSRAKCRRNWFHATYLARRSQKPKGSTQ